MADLLESHVAALRSGIDGAFDRIEDKLADLVFTQTLPLIGDGLKDQYNAQVNSALTYVRQVKAQMTAFLDTVDTADDRAEAFVENGLNGVLNPFGLSVDVVLNAGDVSISLVGSKSYTYSQSLDSGLGLGPLNLSTSGTAEATLSYGINLGIGVDSNGFYVAAPAGNEITLDLDIGAPGLGDPVFNADAHLGFLNFAAADNGSVLDASFAFNLSDGDGRLRIGEMDSNSGYASATVGANASIDIHLGADMGSGAFPSISADLVVDWSIAAGTSVNPNGGFVSGTAPTVTFENVQMDLGSFMNDFVVPFLDEVYKVIQPIATALAVLNTDVKFLKVIPGWSGLFDKTGNEDGSPDGKITLLDFLELAQPGIDLTGVIKLMNIVDSLIDWVEFLRGKSFGPESFNLGDFQLPGDIRDVGFVLNEVLPAVTVGGESITAALARLNGVEWTTPDPVTHETGKAVLETMLGDAAFDIPILSDPMSIFGLLTGKTVDLLTLDLPSVDISLSDVTLASWSVFPTVWVDLYGSLELMLDLGIGYDTRGLSLLADSGFSDFSQLINGLYLNDFNADGDERPEITIRAEIELIGNFDIAIFELGGGGGVDGTVYFDLDDDLWTPGSPAGRIYLDSMAAALASNPFSIFETSGRITAGLTAYAKLLGFEVWRANSPRVTLGSFNFDSPVLPGYEEENAPSPRLGDLSGSTLLVNIGDLAGNRAIPDHADGDESVEIGLVAGKVTLIGFDTQESFTGVTGISANGGAGNDEIILDSALTIAATLSGGAGNDVLAGGAGADSLSGGADRDTLQGGDGDDTLDGGDGDDILYGGAGADSLVGGLGRDVATYFDATTGVLINLSTGATSGDQAAGDSFSGIEIIEGGEYADTLTGGADSDTFVGFGGDDSLDGGDNNDVLIGNGGNDTLVGGTGADIMVGGMGNDVYYVDSLSDQVSENRISEIPLNTDGGHDAVYASIDYDLQLFSINGSEIEHDLRDIEDLYLIGGARQGTGNSLDNKIMGTAFADTLSGLGGNDSLIGGDGADLLEGGDDADTLRGGIGNDTLDGGAGIDSLDGGDGNDTYFVDDAADVIVETDLDDIDIMRTSTSYTLGSGVRVEFMSTTDHFGSAALELEGNEFAQYLTGNAGNNVLEGRGGADTLNGNGGIDTVTYRHAASYVTIDLERAAQIGGEADGDVYIDIDVVEGSSWSDDLYGTSGGDHLRGLGNADYIDGRGGDDSLVGGTGNDTLVGGAGDDTMVGGAGDDVYYVDSLSDVVDEAGDSGDGVDLIIASLSYSLGGNDNVENLTITGSADHAIGNTRNNVITATSHADTIDGGTGADTMYGGDGDDLYYIDSLDDRALENANEGRDKLLVTTATMAFATSQVPDPVIEYTLNTWGEHVEDLTITDANWRINITGNARDNRIESGTRDNIVYALDGNDTIVAGGGRDSVYGGDGDDRGEFAWDSLGTTDEFDGGNNVDTLVMDWSAIAQNIQFYSDAYRQTYYAYAPSAGTNAEMTYHNVERFALYGGSGEDDLRGGDLGDTLSGGAGDDRLIGGTGPGTYDGGAGVDFVQADVATSAGNDFNLAFIASQSVEQVSNAGTDIETRWSGVEVVNLTTGGGNDTLDSRLATLTNTRIRSEDGNEFRSGDGDDTFLTNFNSTGSHYFDAGDGTDMVVIDWRGATSNIQFQSDAYGFRQHVYSPSVGSNTFVQYLSVERFEIYGGSGTDDLRGGALDDTLSGGAGDDQLLGYAGKGVYDGGDGVDFVEATVASDVGLDFTLSLSASQTAEQVSNAGTSIETRWTKVELVDLTTGAGNDTLDTRLDTLTNTRVWASEDGNEFRAGDGNDTFLTNFNSIGSHYFDGQGGVDKVYIDWSAAASNIAFYSDTYATRQHVYTPAVGANTFVEYLGVERFEIYGGSGHDDLRGGTYDDTLSGGDGDDRLLGGRGPGVYNGGAGVDRVAAEIRTIADADLGLDFTLSLAATQAGPVIVNAGTDVETTWQGIETLDLVTGAGNDTLDISLATLTYTPTWDKSGTSWTSNGGNDTFVTNYFAYGQHGWTAGDGEDLLTIDWSAATQAVSYYADAYGQRYQVYVPNFGSSSSVSFTGVERFDLTGGSADDDLRGGTLADTLIGGNGNDRLIGSTGKGTYDGGAGTDRVEATIASDVGLDFVLSLVASQGTEQVANSGTAIETRWSGIEVVDLTLGAGNDTLDARLDSRTGVRVWSQGGNRFDAGAGDDTFKVNFNAQGDHVFLGGDGTDTLVLDFSTAASNIGYGGTYFAAYDPTVGSNTRVDFSSVERFDLTGGSGDDDLRGSALDDTLVGGGGNDRLIGSTGTGTFNGGVGTDRVEATIASDVGLDFVLSLAASQGAEQIVNTGTTIETRWSGIEVVDLTLGAGNDTLDVRLDSLTGVRIWSQEGNRFDAGAGDDTFKVNYNAQGSHLFLGGDGTDTLVLDFSTAAYNIVSGGTYFSAYDPSVGGNTRVDFSSVERFDLTGGSGHDNLTGGSGNDTLRGNAGNDTIVGGDGDDTAIFTGAESDYQVTDQGSGVFIVTDLRLDGDGTDEVRDVEHFVFLGTPPNAAPTDIALSTGSVAENTANGTQVATLSATDADADDTATFELLDDGGGAFTIAGNKLVVADATLLDAEATASISIEVRVTDSGGETYDKSFSIAITDVDEFNTSAVADLNGTTDRINENVAIGTVVGVTASASDGDATTNAITYSLDNSAGGRFSIGASDGIVRTAALIDREVLGASQTIVVRATSADGSFSTKSFTVGINDVDEFNVTTPADVNAAANALTEGAVANAAVGITVRASDADATSNAVTYSLVSNANGLLKIGADGIVRLTRTLDRETDGATVSFTARATSADGSSSTRAFSFSVANVPGISVPANSKGTKVVGTAEEDSLNAGGGKDTISGLGGKDTIDGGADTDTVSYTEKTAPVAVTLNGSKFVTVSVGGAAEDSIKNVENVIGGSGADRLTGDKLANVLTGGGGNDTLKGAAGKDTLDGGAGIDTADYSDKSSAVTVKLNGAKAVSVKVGSANEDTIKAIENLIGGSKADKLTGDGAANLLQGNAGNDTLDGGGGNDTLAGGAGKDQLKGGGGKDYFVFDAKLSSSTADKISDFSVKDDTIRLDNAAMPALGSSWNASMFLSLKSGNKAATEDQHIIYDQKTGDIWYDADGSKPGVKPVLIATLTNHPANVTWADFEIV